MKHWVLIFAPATYPVVKAKRKIAVRDGVKNRFFSKMNVGDRFVGYVSQSCLFDCVGQIASDAFGEEAFDYHPTKQFPWRRKVTFESSDLSVKAGNLFNGIAPFNTSNTSPGNLLSISGGFVEVSKDDFEWLLAQITGAAEADSAERVVP